MAAVPTTNNGSTFYNGNECRSFNLTIKSTMTQLSAQPCSQLTIHNTTSGLLSVYDCGFSAEPFALQLDISERVAILGLTNASEVSAKAATPGRISYRTQFFTSNPIR